VSYQNCHLAVQEAFSLAVLNAYRPAFLIAGKDTFC